MSRRYRKECYYTVYDARDDDKLLAVCLDTRELSKFIGKTVPSINSSFSHAHCFEGDNVVMYSRKFKVICRVYIWKDEDEEKEKNVKQKVERHRRMR